MLKIVKSKETSEIAVVTGSKRINGDNLSNKDVMPAGMSGMKSGDI
jgi:hypothetical protein